MLKIFKYELYIEYVCNYLCKSYLNQLTRADVFFYNYILEGQNNYIFFDTYSNICIIIINKYNYTYQVFRLNNPLIFFTLVFQKIFHLSVEKLS